jgi:hypothetical protein
MRRLAMLSTGYQLAEHMVPLKQLVQHDPIEQPAQSQAEQQGRQKRESYGGRKILLLLAPAMPGSITAIVEVRRLKRHLQPPRTAQCRGEGGSCSSKSICRQRFLPSPATKSPSRALDRHAVLFHDPMPAESRRDRARCAAASCQVAQAPGEKAEPARPGKFGGGKQSAADPTATSATSEGRSAIMVPTCVAICCNTI